jgi:hypothetical protein
MAEVSVRVNNFGMAASEFGLDLYFSFTYQAVRNGDMA